MTIDKKHPHGVLGASLAMGSRGIIPAEAVESKSPRPGREWWDRLCALPRHMFLLKPSGTGVQKLEDPSGNWIDVHDAQRLMDGAQSDINELRGEVERLKAENTALRCAGEIVAGAIPKLDAARARNAALEGLLREAVSEPFMNPERRKRIDAALAEGARCQNCKGHGVIGYTRGQTPEGFEQGEYPCPECRPVEPAKTCAAKYGTHECNAARAEDSLFCAQHRHVDGRQRMGSAPITKEQLAYMMQRDGEQQ